MLKGATDENITATEQTPSSDEDHVVQLTADEKACK